MDTGQDRRPEKSEPVTAPVAHPTAQSVPATAVIRIPANTIVPESPGSTVNGIVRSAINGEYT